VIDVTERADLCELLEWDSLFWGFAVGRVCATSVDGATLSGIASWQHERRVQCLYFLAKAEDVDAAGHVEGSGFRIVDVRLSFARGVNGEGAARAGLMMEGVREARDADIAALRAIARESHNDSRFYHDPGFPRDRCDELYATWIENSCRGYADLVLVVDRGECLHGYISCHVRPEDSEVSVGLLGVRREARGMGVGTTLVRAAIEYAASTGASRISVVTQARNRAAQRLYQREGFSLIDVGIWFHRWYDAHV
jgi:ribosomal protein S18 acetylase RimI-like enzyme